MYIQESLFDSECGIDNAFDDEPMDLGLNTDECDDQFTDESGIFDFLREEEEIDMDIEDIADGEECVTEAMNLIVSMSNLETKYTNYMSEQKILCAQAEGNAIVSKNREMYSEAIGNFAKSAGRALLAFLGSFKKWIPAIAAKITGGFGRIASFMASKGRAFIQWLSRGKITFSESFDLFSEAKEKELVIKLPKNLRHKLAKYDEQKDMFPDLEKVLSEYANKMLPFIKEEIKTGKSTKETEDKLFDYRHAIYAHPLLNKVREAEGDDHKTDHKVVNLVIKACENAAKKTADVKKAAKQSEQVVAETEKVAQEATKKAEADNSGEGFFATLIKTIGDIIKAICGAIKSVFMTIVGVIQGIFSAIGSFISGEKKEKAPEEATTAEAEPTEEKK